MTTVQSNYKYMGVSDEITVCECCNKRNLKRTVALSIDGTVVFYGSNCAAKALKIKKSGVDSVADAMATVQRWSASEKNFSAEIIAKGIWNKFGYLYDLRDNKISFHFGTFDMNTKTWV